MSAPERATQVTTIPVLLGKRIKLRGFVLGDARNVQLLAGDERIAATTLNIPHPYPDGAAEGWIGTHETEFSSGEGVTWAVTLRDTGALIGAIGLSINREHNRATMGYWIAVPYWNQGYGTEAARLVLQYGFEVRRLRRIDAEHFAGNPASGRLMRKIGMTHEGTLRQHLVKWGRVDDAEYYGILREEFERNSGSGSSGSDRSEDRSRD
ncbi:MAG: N-acetyltransferase [Phycisphaerales bacterium]|nr:MAG: N-acetyltransferase [Phycisphaerales bacterium]